MSFSLIPQMLLPGYGSLTPEMLRERGIRLLLCDLDYTLAPKYVPGPDETLHRWLAAMGEAGIRVMILSNNRSGKRVNDFCRGFAGIWALTMWVTPGSPLPGDFGRPWKRPGSRRSRPPCWAISSSPMY